MIVHDCNPTPEGIRAILQGAYEVGIPCTSGSLSHLSSRRLATLQLLHQIWYGGCMYMY